MIAVFADQRDTELLSWVSSASSLIGIPKDQITVFHLASDHVSLEARDNAGIVATMDACIIDVDVSNLVAYAAEFGSFAMGLGYLTHSHETFRRTSLDARVLLVTRKQPEDSEVIEWFGKFYSMISLSGGINDAFTKALTLWLKDTLAASIPKIFISYRSSQKSFAYRVAESLKRRGAQVWFDEWNIFPGDSIPEVITRGLGWCTHLVLLVDESFFESRWANFEVESVLYRHLSGNHYFRGQENKRPLIPLFLADVKSLSMPITLQRIRGINCNNQTFRASMNDLWKAITAPVKVPSQAEAITSQAEAIKRPQNNNPEMEVTVDELGWITCPNCGIRFSNTDKNRWFDNFHTTCGQKIKLKDSNNTAA